jgi:hypothetical protein
VIGGIFGPTCPPGGQTAETYSVGTFFKIARVRATVSASAVRSMAFADRSWLVTQDVQEISRFSYMLFLSVRGFSDYAGPYNRSRLSRPCCLPPQGKGVGILIHRLSKLNSPAH